jgi:hypothetical protein
VSGYLGERREDVLPEREECAPIKFVNGTPNRLSWTLESETRHPLEATWTGWGGSPRDKTKATAVADERRSLRTNSEGSERFPSSSYLDFLVSLRCSEVEVYREAKG